MAIEMSEQLLKRTSFRYEPIVKAQIALRHLIWFQRSVRRRFHRGGNPELIDTSHNVVGVEWTREDLEIFRSQGYVFKLNFLPHDLWRDLVTGFPPRVFFRPRANPVKSYEFGFKFVRGNTHSSEITQQLLPFPALRSLYELALSDSFANCVNELCGDGIIRECYSIVSSRAYSRSVLLPHKDSIAGDDDDVKNSFLNIILFVDAHGHEGGEVGATGIYGDNEFRAPLFVPQCLRNSALIYKSSAPFFHGFPRMSKGSRRLTINIQFARKIGVHE